MFKIRAGVTKTDTKKRFLVILIVFIIIAIFPFGKNEPIEYIERSTEKVKTEKVAGERWLRWLYNNPIGELSLDALVKRKFVSEWYGGRMDSPYSKEKVANFVKEYEIDLSIAEKQEFESFNDFFTRKLKPEARKIDTNKNVLISPSDGKLFAYANIENQDFIVKGYKFNIFEYLQNDSLAELYKNGSLVIVRLCPTDYHRYHFPVTGTVINKKEIDGDYYSVSPIALKKRIEIFCLNKRNYCEIKTQNFDNIIMSEVGATMVGSMVYTFNNYNIEKGQERGYFKFGGSTVVLFFKNNQITIDKDLLLNTKNKLETEVEMGERIGVF